MLTGKINIWESLGVIQMLSGIWVINLTVFGSAGFLYPPSHNSKYPIAFKYSHYALLVWYGEKALIICFLKPSFSCIVSTKARMLWLMFLSRMLICEGMRVKDVRPHCEMYDFTYESLKGTDTNAHHNLLVATKQEWTNCFKILLLSLNRSCRHISSTSTSEADER